MTPPATAATADTPMPSGAIFTPSEGRAPPIAMTGPVAWVRQNLFGSWLSTAVTLLLFYLIVTRAIAFIDWAFINAIWSVPNTPSGPDTRVCRALQGSGACWALIGEKYRFITFGTYPYEEQWRPAICIVLFIGLYIVSAMKRFWRKELALVWLGTLTAIGVLMWGGVLGMSFVPQERWGGLPITLILSTFGIALAFPVAIFVALGRRSAKLPAVKMLWCMSSLSAACR
jgi:general L-amino acid transport system permease protein